MENRKKVTVVMSTAARPGDPAWYKQEFPFENKLTEKESLELLPADAAENCILENEIRIFPEKICQEITGFGISLEESTIHNLAKMQPQSRENFLRKLIDPKDGYGLTWFRLTIGTADFTAQDFYTYYDCKPEGEYDWYNKTGHGFSIEKDFQYHIVETAQQIISIAKELGIRDEIRFFASPWTPPGWMKTPTADSRTYENNGLLLKGGNFNSDYTEELAVYYVRYLEEYAQLGIPVYAMTLQNEPYLDIDYPSCLMTPTQQAELAVMLKEKIAKSSILKKEQVNPQLWGFDHNFEDAWKYTNEISDSEGWKCLDGLAFHSYAGDPVVMEQLVKAFPDKSMHHTERSVWGAGGAAEIITWLRNSSCSYCAWVSMLDSNISTHHWVDTPGPTIFIQNAENPDEYKILPEAYIMGQFARYIRPGYVRVESTECSEDFRHVACKNPLTGKTVLVAANASDDSHTMQVFCGDEMFSAEVPAGTVATYIW